MKLDIARVLRHWYPWQKPIKAVDCNAWSSFDSRILYSNYVRRLSVFMVNWCNLVRDQSFHPCSCVSPRAYENSILSFVRHQLAVRNNNHHASRTLQAQGSAECQNEVGGLWESCSRPKVHTYIQPFKHTGFTFASKELADTASEIKRPSPIGF